MKDNFKETAEEAAGKGLDESEYLARLQKFYQDNCEACGSQRCLGVYDEDWREGCKLYREEFKRMKKTEDAPEGYVYAPWIPVTTASYINGVRVWDRRWWMSILCKINWFFHFRMRKRHNKWRRSEVKVGKVMHFAQFPGEQTSNNK